MHRFSSAAGRVAFLGLLLANYSPVQASEAPQLLSAFFGLDNALPFRANRLCLGASGKDGMPVVLSHTIDDDTLDAEDFQVTTQAGQRLSPHCVTLRPAEDPGEGRTVLLIGEFGDAADDPPISVQVVGDVLSDTAPPVNFRSQSVEVIPLAAGPTLIYAQTIPLTELAAKTRSTRCPADTRQVVRVTWAGGVRSPSGDDPGDPERALYQVTVRRENGTRETIAPAALADLEDRDNNHLLCLDTSDPAMAVEFPAGHLVDPNQDLNLDSRITVAPAR
ncbi:MAG: hypothetical protein AAF993_20130 [Pseudomonadota bacterium]